MTTRPLLLAGAASILMSGCQSMAPASTAPLTPVPGFGTAFAAPGADMQVDPRLHYRVVLPATRAAATPDAIVPALERAARFLNLLGAAGRRTLPGDVVVVVSGPATPAVLDDAAWRARHPGAASNPNLPLIRALRDAGVVVSVCSQALHGQHIAAGEVDPAVRQDLSAMTTLAELQPQGFALIPE